MVDEELAGSEEQQSPRLGVTRVLAGIGIISD